MTPDWRELGPDEVIQEGDEWRWGAHWFQCKDSLGYKMNLIDGVVRTRRPLPDPVPTQPPTQNEWRELGKDEVIDYCRKWAAEHLAGHGKETFYARLGLLVDFATDFYSDEIQKLKEAQP